LAQLGQPVLIRLSQGRSAPQGQLAPLGHKEQQVPQGKPEPLEQLALQGLRDQLERMEKMEHLDPLDRLELQVRLALLDLLAPPDRPAHKGLPDSADS
jgi:hypothetical protein